MDRESRYVHLLQPIRDISKIWNIEIADELEHYLEELEQLELLYPEDGITRLNFAEAALLIQGSTHIYSRKVEYLYALVYQALETLGSQKAKEAAANKKGRSGNAALWDIPEGDGLVTLDGLLREGRGIDLDEDLEGSTARNPTRRTPLWLMPREEKDRNRNEFKICACLVHSSGTFLLQESDLHWLDEILQRGSGNAEGDDDMDGAKSPLAPAPPDMEDLDTKLQSLVKVLGDDYDEVAFAAEKAKEEQAELDLAEKEESPQTGASVRSNNVSPGTVKSNVSLPLSMRLSQKKGRGGLKGLIGGGGFGAVGGKIRSPEKDPWEPLDEHLNQGKEKPLAPGRGTTRKPPIQLLASLQDLEPEGGEGRQESDSWDRLIEQGQMECDPFAMAATMAQAHPVEGMFCQALVGLSQTKGGFLTEKMGFSTNMLGCEELLESERRRKRREKFLEIRTRQLQGGGLGGGLGPLVGDGLDGDEDGCSDAEGEEEEQEALGVKAPSSPSGATPKSEQKPLSLTPRTPGGGIKPMEEEEEPQVSEEQRLLEEQKQQMFALERQIEDAQRVYEATVRKHLEKMQQRCVDLTGKDIPQLYATVRRWQDALEPVLKEQNTRPDFDIFGYGTKMIGDLQSLGGVVPFKEVVRGCPRWEVGRRFLTALVLTNHGNIDIVAGNEEERLNRFGLKLLNARKELPSLHEDPDAEKAKAKGGRKAKVAKTAPENDENQAPPTALREQKKAPEASPKASPAVVPAPGSAQQRRAAVPEATPKVVAPNSASAKRAVLEASSKSAVVPGSTVQKRASPEASPLAGQQDSVAPATSGRKRMRRREI